MSTSSYSRRNFISGAAAVAGAAALAGCDNKTTPAATTDEFWLPTTWQSTADVIVVGFGAAGASAAYFAAKAGAKVTVLDVSKAGGGDTAVSGGFVFFGGGTALQTSAGVSETPDQLFTTMRAMGGEAADPEIQKVWCNRNKELYDFLMQVCGESWTAADMIFTGNEAHPLFASVAPNGIPAKHGLLDAKGGAGLFAKISAAVLATPGVTLTPLTRVTRLIQDPQTKRVLGVAAKAVDDTGAFVDGATETFFKASKGVLIATGAFTRDTAMCARHNPEFARITDVSQTFADGSGIRLGQTVGGDLRSMRTFWSYCLKAGTPAFSKSILVNPAGFRFVPEDSSPYYVGYHLVRQHPTAFLISDSTINATKPDGAYTGATIEELVTAINTGEGTALNAALLKGTLQGYNALANADGKTGVDPVYKKAAANVVPIATGPFYAQKILSTDAIGTTTGGLRINPKSQLLDPTGTVIPNVYAAGTCSSAVPSETYTGSGTAISSCLTFGKIAAEGLVAETAWT